MLYHIELMVKKKALLISDLIYMKMDIKEL